MALGEEQGMELETGDRIVLKLFGAKLRLLRECCAASQRELAAASGVSRSSLSRYETGRGLPRLEQFLRLVAALHADIDDLRIDTGMPPEENLAAMRLLFKLKGVSPPEAKTTLQLIDGLLGELTRLAPKQNVRSS